MTKHSEELEKSLLMTDSSEGDGKKEAMMDFVLSWTLRRADVAFAGQDPLLYRYCRAIMGKLIGVAIDEATEVTSVEVWKQWRGIDLHANITLCRNGQEEHHALLIENKAYSGIHDDQLARYKKLFEATYSEGDLSAYTRHYALVTAHDDVERYEAKCRDNGYTLFAIGDLQCQKAEKTGSDIFNEFWLTQW